jgi:hypothetical protein
MKIISIVVTCLVLIILFQSYIVMSTNKTEEQKNTLVKDYDDFEIRFYPSATLATINSTAKTYKELASPGFRNLAAYIFGGNSANQKIAMTAPVHMDINDSLSKMSFVMPSTYTTDNLPKPNDPKVNISKKDAEYVAVIKFGGFASDKDIQFYSEKLQTLLKENNIKSIGNFRLYGYNPPYQLVQRRNEIVVSVEWKE